MIDQKNFLLKCLVVFIISYCFLQLINLPVVWAQSGESKGDLSTIIGDLSQGNDQVKNAISSLGLGDPQQMLGSITTAKVVAWVLFNGIGFVAFVYAKKQKAFGLMIIGILLMTYNLFITNTAWLYTIGVALCVALFFFRE